MCSSRLKPSAMADITRTTATRKWFGEVVGEFNWELFVLFPQFSVSLKLCKDEKIKVLCKNANSIKFITPKFKIQNYFKVEINITLNDYQTSRSNIIDQKEI